MSIDDYSYGAPGIDAKRPYGNKNVVKDVVNILDWEYAEEGSEVWHEQEKRVCQLQRELEHALQIVLCHAGQAVEPGIYHRSPYGREWKLLKRR